MDLSDPEYWAQYIVKHTEGTWEKEREKYFVWIFLYDIKSYQWDQHTSKTHSGWYKSWNNVSWVSSTQIQSKGLFSEHPSKIKLEAWSE